MATYVVRIARHAVVVLLFLAAAVLGTVSGVVFAYSDDLPEISALDDYQPNTITQIFARDGRQIGQFATERRVVVDYDHIAPVLREAIIATEDADFEQHFGMSVLATARAVVRNLLTGERKGASTITQQVARDLFLRQYMREGGVYVRTGFEGIERKVKEWLVALQIERRYTKREIFTFYANQIALGHGAYGVEAASRLYFAKPAQELRLDEAAILAGMIQAPSRLSPFVNPKATLQRRAYVLQRMTEEGYITEAEARQAQDHPLELHGQPQPPASIAPYFVEEVRKILEARFGADALYQSGLRVRTTLDADLQAAANQAIDRGLRRVDKRRGYRKAARNIVDEGHRVDAFAAERWQRPMKAGDIVPAVVSAVAPKAGARSGATVRVGPYTAELSPADFAWTRRTHAADLMRVGDLVEVELTADPGEAKTVSARLEQAPLLQGALVAVENRTGQILAMVGGADFALSKFNRATQAYRQMGSTFKPILYTAAIDRGMTPSTILTDAPVSFNVGPNQPPYTPHNYEQRYEGPVTLRRALEESLNIPAVRVMEMLGPAQVVPYTKNFGFPEQFPAYLSTALGATEATLLEATSAYSAFPNNGVRLQPYMIGSIVDRGGNLLVENRPDPRDAIRADTAFVMTNLLEGVIARGTGAAAASLNWPLAGKTGTVDDYTDAWFIGFDPTITVGVWIGYDEKKPIGANQTGAQAALPVWIDFMRAYIEARGDRANPPSFEAPGNVVFVTVDAATGEPLADGTPGGLHEAFIAGTQPARP